uniref:J domain-containing protein n=1 Tax=Tetranychus urticae TaxID=32264 RepID=T1KMH0_TETUR
MVYRSTDLIQLFDPSEESMVKIYRKLALNFHPDKNPDKLIAEELMKMINHHYRLIETNDDETLDRYPIFVSKYSDGQCHTSQPVILQEGKNIQTQFGQVFGVPKEEIIGWTGIIRPWSHVTVVINSEPVKKSDNRTDIDFIKDTFLDRLLTKVNNNMLLRAIEEFLVIGKMSLKNYLDKRTGIAKIKLASDFEIEIKTGKNLNNRDLTFANGQNWKLPGLSKYIIPNRSLPQDFAVCLHHGIQFSWNLVDNEADINKSIYLAIQAMEMIFININRLGSNLPLLSSAASLEIIPRDLKTWNEDLRKYIGYDRLNSFETKNKIWLKETLFNIKFKPADLRVTGFEDYI